MGITTIILYLIYSIILFLIIEYLKTKNKTNSINQIAISLIYLIIISGLSMENANNIFLVIVIELILRIFYTNHILEKNFLHENNNIKAYIITIIIGYILNITFINKVSTVFPNPNDLKIIIWLAIIIFIYKILKETITINPSIPKEKTFNNKEEYIVTEYAKLKNKYYQDIKPQNNELIPIIYSIMIYEDYYNPLIKRKLDIIKFKLENEERKLGIMQIKTKKIINDEESILLATKKLEKIYNKLSKVKKNSKDNLALLIIKEYTKNENSTEEIIDIYKQIIEFDQK